MKRLKAIPWTRYCIECQGPRRRRRLGRNAFRHRKELRQRLSGVAPIAPHDVFRRALRDDLAAPLAAFGAKIDNPVRRLDHVEIVLNHDHRIAVIGKAMQHFEQFLHVLEVQSCRWLIQ